MNVNTRIGIKSKKYEFFIFSFMQTSESTTPVRSKADEKEKYMLGNSIQKTSEPEAEISPGNLPVTANMKASENLKHVVNHDDVFEVWLYDYSGTTITMDKNFVFHHCQLNIGEI